jgi:peptide deformylase
MIPQRAELEGTKRKTAVHELIYYGHETLRRVAEEVANIDGKLIKLIDAMYNVMYRAKGIGLAAPQVDESRRVIVIDLDDRGDVSMELINPVIKQVSDKQEPYEEGCLSVPGISGNVIRPVGILVSGVNRDGKEIELEADGMLARVIQHEVDHLNGVLFIDRLADFEKSELRPELKQIKKLNRRL